MRFEFITVYPQIILIFTCNAAILQQFISIFPLPSFVQLCQTFNLCIFCKHHNTQALITSKKFLRQKIFYIHLIIYSILLSGPKFLTSVVFLTLQQHSFLFPIVQIFWQEILSTLSWKKKKCFAFSSQRYFQWVQNSGLTHCIFYIVECLDFVVPLISVEFCFGQQLSYLSVGLSLFWSLFQQSSLTCSLGFRKLLS